MSNKFWNNIRTFLPGSRARGNIVDDDLDGITAGFDTVEVDITRAIKLATSTTDQVLTHSVANRIGKYLVFDSSGNITLSAGSGADSGLRTDLASLINGAGASLVGVEDSAGNFTGTTVEAVLAEIIADLAATTASNGASKIGVQDSAGNFTGTNVETVLAEIAGEAISGSPIYGGASSAGTDTYAATLPVSPGAYAAGQRFSFSADVANTGACTINFNAIGAKSIKLADGSDPFTGAINATSIVDVQYDGTNFILLNPDDSVNPLLIQTTGDQTMAGNLKIDNVFTPVLTIEDSTSSGTSSEGWVEFRDSLSAQKGVVGNSGGDIYLSATAAGYDVILSPGSGGKASVDGNTVWDDSGSNGPAAVAGYTKVGSGVYTKDSTSNTFLTYNTLTAVAAPTGATGVIVSLSAVSKTGNAIGDRSSDVLGYTNSSGTGLAFTAQSAAREFIATSSGTLLNWSSVIGVLPVIAGNAYVKHAARDGGNQGAGYYSLIGYTI